MLTQIVILPTPSFWLTIIMMDAAKYIPLLKQMGTSIIQCALKFPEKRLAYFSFDCLLCVGKKETFHLSMESLLVVELRGFEPLTSTMRM